MAKILDEILKKLPSDASISDACFEGANIVLYTKNAEFFFDNNGLVKSLVNEFKKRIEVRPDPVLCLDAENSKKIINKILPKDAGKTDIIFDAQRSIVVIEAEKPGTVIGKQGEVLREIKKKTLWVPIVTRIPAIRSPLIENIRGVLYENNDYRRKFLNKIGKRIYSDWTKEKREEWIRITCLGAGKEVGRSCFLLQTPESKVLLDCGINVAGGKDNSFPFLDAPEFTLNELDAVIVSHAHVDHCLHPDSYIQLGDGTITSISDFYKSKKENIKCLDIDDSMQIEDWNCFEKVKIPAPAKMYKLKTKSREIVITGEHPFFLLNNFDMIHKKAKDLKIGDFIATAKKIPFSGKNQKLKDCVRTIVIDEIGKKILKQERIRREFKQLDVSKTIGCTQTTISAIEKKQNYSCSLVLLKRIVEFYGLDEKFINRYTYLKRNKSIKIRIPKKTSGDLMQFIGYFLGDGHKVNYVRKGKRYVRVEATDKDIKNLETYRKIGKKIFNLEGSIHCKSRNRLSYYSPILLDFLEDLSEKILCRSPKREIPNVVHKVTKKELAGFLRGLYDAEGSIGDHHIVLTSTSKNIIYICQMLLLRYQVNSHIYEYTKLTKSGRKAYQLTIYSQDSIKRFARDISFSDLKKKDRLRKLEKKIGKGVAQKMDLIPLEKDTLLKIANKLNLRKTDLRTEGIHYYHYLKHNPSREKLHQMLKIFQARAKRLNIKLTELDKLSKLVSSDIMWDPILRIEEIASDCEYVYDLKVAGHHNYIANGIIVHNCGLVPYLFKMGYRGPVYMTSPTRDVGSLLCLDMIGISNKEGEGSLYGSGDVKEMVKHTVTLEYEEVTDITPDIRITLYNAGHNLGSSLVHMHIGNGLHNFLYTGDFNFETSNLLSSAITKFPRLESVMMEGTYGSKKDILPSRKECEDELIGYINETAKKGGKVLMPILGVGRSQELMLILERAMREKRIPSMPIYLQGMVWDVNAIHTAYPDFFNARVKREIFQQDQNPFLSEIFQRVGSQKEMQDVIEGKGPYIVMATSGMLTGGASLTYFKAFAENPKNILIITSYQGIGSLGRRIEEGERELSFVEGGSKKQEMVHVKMDIKAIKGFTGHSSFSQIKGWVQRLEPKPRRIIIVHGEQSKCLELASFIYQTFRIETTAPKNLETIRLR